MLFSRRKMKLKTRSTRYLANRFAWLVISLGAAFFIFIYVLNSRLMPTYLQYAEVQTTKIASHVVGKAINSRTTNVLDVNDIIENLPSGTSDMVTTKFNTEIINRVRSDTTELVNTYLKQAEQGDLTHLPALDYVEYDTNQLDAGDGIVFFVPIGQAINVPILGNLGPKIPIRFHIIGNVGSSVKTKISEFGINNAYVEVGIHVQVNVQIIVPFASKSATVSQKIPVAIGLIRGTVPHIYTTGEGGGIQPSIEAPVPSKENEKSGTQVK